MCMLRQIILLHLHKIFMNRSLLQPSPSKKSNDNSNAIRDARSGSFRSTMSSYTEVMIETNDLDVPFISIFKPDIKKEQRRVQAVTSIDKCLKKLELFRINFAFSKLAATKAGEKYLKDKVTRFEQLFAKMAKKRVVSTFWKIATNKSRKKNVEAASKLLNCFQTSKRRSNIREGMNRLKFHSLHTQVRTLHDESQLSRELTLVKNELFLLKQQAFSQQFLQASKNQLRLADNQTYIDNLRQSNYRQSLVQQLSRFQQIRTKRAPKKKDLLVPQQIITVLNNTVKAYQGILADHLSYQQELRQQLEGYTNTEGISQLTEQIRQRDSTISEIDSFLNDISKMDAEMKRFTGEKLNSEKIMSLISQHQKRLEIKVKKMEGIVPKINISRMFLNSIICSALKRWGEDKQSWGKQIEQLVKIGNEEDSLKVFIQRIREKTSVKVLAQLLYGYHQQIATLQENHSSRLAVLEKDASSAEDLRKQVIDLNRKIAELTRKLDLQKASISNLLSFIQDNQSRISSNRQIKQRPAQKIDPHLEPILTSIVNIFRNNKALEDKNFEFQRQIHMLEQRQSNHFYSETKIIKQVQNQPAWKLIDVRDSDISLAERFLQPLNELIEGRKEDLQLKHQLINIQGKIQEIISHNVRLQQELLKLQDQVIKLEANDKAMKEFGARNAQLKQENERLREYEQKYYQLIQLNQSKNETQEQSQLQIKIKEDFSKTSEHQYLLHQQSLINSQARDRQVISLQANMREQEELIVSLKQERERLTYESRSWQSRLSSSEETVVRQRHELSQARSQLQSAQMELHRLELAQGHAAQSAQVFQAELQEKQAVIAGLLEQGRALSASFGAQLQQLRQEHAAREQAQADRLADKDNQIQKLEIQLAEKRMNQNISVSDIPQQSHSQNSLYSKISDYQYRIRQLTLINSELSQKVESLKESHSQFSSIASSNLQLSQKINEIYRKSTSQPLLQSNEQQLMKQTEMMKQILTLKLEAENQAMNHLRDISTLRSQINSYQTIISKLENDIMQKDNYILQQEGMVKSLQYKYKEEKEVNEELKVKIEKFQHVVSIQTTTRFKEGEAELNRLKDQCYRIYEQLQKSIENLEMRDRQVVSLQANMREQEELIVSLKQERERLAYESRSWQSRLSSSEETVVRQRHELSQARSQLQSAQMELHRLELAQSHAAQSAQVFQAELQEKQAVIAGLLEQGRALSASFGAQLQQLRQEHAAREQAQADRLADKDNQIQKLEIQLAEKSSTITSLQHLISLYSNGEQDGHAPRHPFSRDKEIQYLNEQIKSLQEFLQDINTQYRQLETRYHQQRQKFHHSQIFSPQKHKDFKKSSGFLSQRRNNKRENESYQSIKFQQSYKEEQLNRAMKSTESLSYSTEIRQGESTDLFLRMRNSESMGLSIELIYNVLLNVAKLPSSSNEGQKIWRDICDMRTLHSGEALFLNLQGYCRQFIASCSRHD